MTEITTAGRLLADLNREGTTVRDAVASVAGVSIERVDAAMSGSLRLSLSEQLRLSEATPAVAPKFARDATRLRSQVLSAKSYQSRELVEPQHDAPIERRDRSADFGR
jgi:hypothetical protein